MNKILKNITICAFALVSMTSCDDFLDVKPKTEVEASDLFAREQGYQDALWGIYTQMTSTQMYGREMTFGMVDVLAQMYSNAGTGTYSYVKNYNYTNASVENMIGTVWSGAYKTIANINSLIENMEKASPSSFEANHYNVLLGEAYGLRAFLHFDMLRLFAPSFVVDPEAKAIPYVTKYGYEITETSTVKQAIDLVLSDLNKASELLKTSDPVVTKSLVPSDDKLLTQRTFHFNYYAAVAEMARVYLYKGDMQNAANCAKEVINSGIFTWTSIDDIATTATNRDRTFSSEQVFTLNIKEMEDNIVNRLNETKYPSDRLMFSSNKTYANYGAAYDLIDYRYTDPSDWRLLYQWSEAVSGNSTYLYKFNNKLWQVEGMPDNYTKRMPIIRLPELYLILAEAEGDKGAASLQTVREHRGITAAVTASTADALRSEILLEYVREFVCEGVMFYQYKRLNSLTMNGYNRTFNTSNYVLPMPQQEIEFGNRN